MLVSRRLGKLISGAYDSLILFLKNSVSAAEAKRCNHSNFEEKNAVKRSLCLLAERIVFTEVWMVAYVMGEEEGRE